MRRRIRRKCRTRWQRGAAWFRFGETHSGRRAAEAKCREGHYISDSGARIGWPRHHRQRLPGAAVPAAIGTTTLRTTTLENISGAISVFAAVVDAGTFAAAADVLGMSPPGVSRAIARLE